MARSLQSARPAVMLRARLLVLLALMVLPFVAFSVFKAQEINRVLHADHHRANLALARSVAYSIDDNVVSTGELLRAVAEGDVARSGDTAALGAWFAVILPDYPHYANLIYVGNDGFIRAAGRKSKDATGPINVADTPYYRRSMATTGLAMGDFMYGKISGAPVVHVCYPVFDEDGARQGFVSAAMHLNRVQDRLMREKTPEHTTIAVIDRRGTVIARNHDPEDWVGTNVYDSLRVKNMIDRGEGEDEANLPSGKRLVCSFTEVDSVPWFVRVGVDQEFIESQTNGQVGDHYAVFLPLLLVAVAGWTWIGRDVAVLHRRTETLSLLDPLTELGNSRSLRADSQAAFGHAQRTGEPLAFMMLDLDDFKSYNDRFGHLAGDEALRATAQAMAAAVRAADRVYRYGGEEFCVMLPDATVEGVLAVAERVRLAVSDLELRPDPNGAPVSVSVSIGVAAYPRDGATIDALMSCADEALYRAKDQGKNRIVVGCGDRGEHGPLMG